MNPPTKIPSWFNDKYSNKIVLLDQSVTFPKKYQMPYTNSNAIETTLSNIPGLSEHFIYFNDDIFLCKPVKYTDFFTNSGKPYVPYTVLNTTNMVKPNKEDILKIKYPKFINKFYPHIPIVLLKSQIIKFQNEYPEYIEWIRSKRSRKGNGCYLCKDYNLVCPCAQQHHLIARYMYDNKKAVLKRYNNKSIINNNKLYLSNMNLHIEHQHFNKYPYIFDTIIKNPPKFLCINDTTSNKQKKEIMRTKMNIFFKEFYPEVPFFERSEK